MKSYPPTPCFKTGIRNTGLMTREYWGQYFIRSPETALGIIDAAQVSEKNTVFEIGPGKGALTDMLLRRNIHTVVIEKDHALIAAIREKYHGEEDSGLLSCYQGDIRDGIPEILHGKPYHCIANIPYYITGKILRVLLQNDSQPKTATLVIQDEVARRITHLKKESVLSLSVKFFGTPTYIQRFPACCFFPVPKVDSGLIRITNIHPQPKKLQEVFFSLIHRCFRSKRKMLRSTLKGNEYRDTFFAFGVTLETRPEDIPYHVWKKVAKQLYTREGNTIKQH